MDRLDLTNPQVRAALEYQDMHATQNIKRVFVAAHPELCNTSREDDLRNEQVINAIIAENGWLYTPETLEAAYLIARQNGQVVVNDLTNPSPQLQEAFDKTSTAKLREFFEKQQQPQHVNRADEFFMSAGGRAKDTILNRGQR